MSAAPATGEERKPFNVNCAECSHTWAAAYLPMEVTKFAKVTSNLHCPNCGAGSKKIFVAKSP